jgi:regulator of protease activity HflC (stomatin/prohibitin superfamily)
MEIAIVIAIAVVIAFVRSVQIVPQQHAWVLERLGKYAGTRRGCASSFPSLIAWPTGTA